MSPAIMLLIISASGYWGHASTWQRASSNGVSTCTHRQETLEEHLEAMILQQAGVGDPCKGGPTCRQCEGDAQLRFRRIEAHRAEDLAHEIAHSPVVLVQVCGEVIDCRGSPQKRLRGRKVIVA